MRRRHSRLPHVWLMTDERLGDLGAAVRRLPRGAGVVFRHHATPPIERRALFREIRQLARARGLVVLLADTPLRAWQWRADGAHHRSRLASRGLRSVAVHDGAERATARAVRADLIFVSPVFATRSHPGAAPLGPVRIGQLAGPMRARAIALGGMNRHRWRRLAAMRLHGWAAIDAWDHS